MNSINYQTIGEIVISWFLSPLLSGICALCLFMLIRFLALRRNHPTKNLLNLFPFLSFLTMFVNSFFIIYKGTPALGLKNTPLSLGIIISLSIGGGSMIIVYLFAVPYLRKKVTRYVSIEPTLDIELQTIYTGQLKLYDNRLNRSQNIKYIEDKLNKLKIKEEDDKINRFHSNAEIFDFKAEKLCSNLQIITACFSAFAHGANDVANAIAPFASIIAIYDSGNVHSKTEVPIWILAIGGGGIVLGLGTWGYKIINRMGRELTKVTPSRGFCMELAMSFTVVLASRIGLPVSTTHCQVGAIVGCGLVDGKKNIDWKCFSKIIFSWFITLPVTGLISAGLFSFGYYSP
jgi:sodium-dependent phosphate transporter